MAFGNAVVVSCMLNTSGGLFTDGIVLYNKSKRGSVGLATQAVALQQATADTTHVVHYISNTLELD